MVKFWISKAFVTHNYNLTVNDLLNFLYGLKQEFNNYIGPNQIIVTSYYFQI